MFIGFHWNVMMVYGDYMKASLMGSLMLASHKCREIIYKSSFKAGKISRREVVCHE